MQNFQTLYLLEEVQTEIAGSYKGDYINKYFILYTRWLCGREVFPSGQPGKAKTGNKVRRGTFTN